MVGGLGLTHDGHPKALHPPKGLRTGFQAMAAAGIVVLLVALATSNSAGIFVTDRDERKR